MLPNSEDGQNQQLKIEITPVFRDIVNRQPFSRGPEYPPPQMIDYGLRRGSSYRSNSGFTDESSDFSLSNPSEEIQGGSRRAPSDWHTRHNRLITHDPHSSPEMEPADKVPKRDTVMPKTQLVCSFYYP